MGARLSRRNDNLQAIILDCTLDYDGAKFYADDTKDHKVYIPKTQKMVVDTTTGELKTLRK